MGLKKVCLASVRRVVLGCLLLQIALQATAGEKEQRIINQAIEAYGGDKLLRLDSLTLTDNIKEFSKGQSGHAMQGPMTMHLSQHQVEITIDFNRNSKVFKRGTRKLVGYHGSHNLFSSHRIFDGGQGYVIDHCSDTFEAVNFINFDNIDAGISQTLDTLIIRQLDKHRTMAKWVDKAFIQGAAHHVLSINPGDKQEYTLYLHAQSGLLSRMVKKHGAQLRSYDFLAHTQQQGISWAQQVFVSHDDAPIYLTEQRKISFPPLSAEQFKLPQGYQHYQQPEYYDVSKLSIRTLAEGVYFVGQEWSYTLFIDVGDYYISAGAWHHQPGFASWKKALALVQQTTGKDKPVKQHVVSHHHTDHMAALQGIVNQGADLIIHPGDIAAVNAHLSSPLPAARFVPISDTTSFANDKILLFDVPNSHASHNLVIYLPEEKILFSEDMFGSSYKSELHLPSGWPIQDTYERLALLMDKVAELALDVEQHLSSHHGRILKQSDIDEATNMGCVSTQVLEKKLFNGL